MNKIHLKRNLGRWVSKSGLSGHMIPLVPHNPDPILPALGKWLGHPMEVVILSQCSSSSCLQTRLQVIAGAVWQNLPDGWKGKLAENSLLW